MPVQDELNEFQMQLKKSLQGCFADKTPRTSKPPISQNDTRAFQVIQYHQDAIMEVMPLVFASILENTQAALHAPCTGDFCVIKNNVGQHMKESRLPDDYTILMEFVKGYKGKTNVFNARNTTRETISEIQDIINQSITECRTLVKDFVISLDSNTVQKARDAKAQQIKVNDLLHGEEKEGPVKKFLSRRHRDCQDKVSVSLARIKDQKYTRACNAAVGIVSRAENKANKIARKHDTRMSKMNLCPQEMALYIMTAWRLLCPSSDTVSRSSAETKPQQTLLSSSLGPQTLDTYRTS